VNLRKSALAIFKAGLSAADPVQAVLRHVAVKDDVLLADGKKYPLGRYRRVVVVGAGKASASMALALERLLGKRITTGLINVKDGHLAKLRRIELNECSHPMPDARGVAGAARIAELAREASADDLVICVISGGGSALLPLPADGVTLEEKQATTRLLLACGATIHEINALRKHISAIKGGQLARLAAPAAVLTLLLSDVIGDDPDVIGSGPTVPDSSTYARAHEILRRYDLLEQVPLVVRARIEAGMRGEVPETPKPGDAIFRRTQNLVVGSNRLAVDACAAKARELGFRTLILSTFVQGETRDVASVHAAIAKEMLASGRPVKPPACVISGGETTVTLKGTGKGGRNQEFALAAAIELARLPDVLVLSGGTDGSDGPTDAAGALADGTTVARGEAEGVEAKDYLANNDSYTFFDRIGDLIRTGPTNTNVMDIRLVLAGR
jgi:glycerate 2-kinase